MKNNVNRLLFWYYALSKRLIKRPSFLVILALIPVFAFGMSSVADEQSGFVSIAVVSQDETDGVAGEVIDHLISETKIARIKPFSNENEAVEAVKRGELDTAWIFLPEMENRIRRISLGENIKLVKIYTAEDNTFVRAAREKILGEIFPYLSYVMYENKVGEIDHALSEAEIKANYEYFKNNELIEYSFLDSAQKTPQARDFLTAPLRGLLCTVMLLCGLAAALYVSNDDREGAFSNLTSQGRAAVFLANNFAALMLAGLFVSLSLALSGNYTTLGRESLLMLLYILASTGFCTLLGALLRSPGRMSAVLPIVLILSVALSPVFFNVRRFRFVQMFFPLYHYLYGINDLRYALTLALWAVFYIAAAYYLYAYKYKGYVKE